MTNSILTSLTEGNKNPPFGEWIFTSNTHRRYQGETLVGEISGHIREIKVEKNISGGRGYSVTILNPKPNILVGHITMATKPMEIVEGYRNMIVMCGYGNDRLSGISFSNYGLSLYFKGASIEKAVLHMFEKGVNIEYLP